jgi:hypothetical protein
MRKSFVDKPKKILLFPSQKHATKIKNIETNLTEKRQKDK